MNTYVLIALSLLSGTLLSKSFRWDELRSLPTGQGLFDTTSQTSADGTIHIFCENRTKEIYSLVYNVYYPNRTLTHKKTIDKRLETNRFADISVQVSDDGKHLLVAYSSNIPHRSRCIDNPDHPCTKILLIESFNGGDDWTEPVSVSNDVRNNHGRASIFFEKDTGRVYITYGVHVSSSLVFPKLAIAVREPGSKVFTSHLIPAPLYYMELTALSQTLERLSSKRHLHLFVRTTLNASIQYAHSEDGGKTWSSFVLMEKNLYGSMIEQVVANSEVDEGGVYVQSEKDGKGIVMWSKDHGKSFERTLSIQGGTSFASKISMCGSRGTGIVLSAHYDSNKRRPYMSIFELHKGRFQLLPYAFGEARGYLDIVAASCVHVGNNKYSIDFIAGDRRFRVANAAHGILDLN
eukprot:TRINITY_DN1566_c0_g1_i2.p1 TRINITY_DN1566_c0_g1~~TRINITY_DN1566_c0_g1_i2.p1  ORF type:complete len:455 (+),score=100.89 TRINITY_DN1566_c0_g1_i2:148-1365(+)